MLEDKIIKDEEEKDVVISSLWSIEKIKDEVFRNKKENYLDYSLMPKRKEQKYLESIVKNYLIDIVRGKYDEKNYELKKKNYIFIPSNVAVRRVPSYVLGEYVLGRAFTGLGLIEILDTLDDEFYEAVLDHEADHMKYPWMTEMEVRKRTAAKFPDFIKA